MGLVHYTATLIPSKQELVEAWLPTHAWARGRAIASKVGEYRFDDPAGEVGIETILYATDDGTVIQVPLSYRAEPLAGADDLFVGTSEHSVLGPRYVYDGCGDPVWAQTLATAILTGGRQAQMFIEKDGQRVDVPARVPVRGSGSPDASVPSFTSVDEVTQDGDLTVSRCGGVVLVLPRTLGTSVSAEARLTGRVGEQEGVVLAGLRA